jgi:hypothetical protein
MTTTDASALEREVVELHGVIEGWFAGTRPRSLRRVRRPPRARLHLRLAERLVVLT